MPKLELWLRAMERAEDGVVDEVADRAAKLPLEYEPASEGRSGGLRQPPPVKLSEYMRSSWQTGRF